jgi:uncharacterized protein YndB with AHSA1/START domain
MNGIAPETLSVVIERHLPHPPEKIWRALTEPHLLEAWLMGNDFAANVGHRFTFSADWGAVRGEVLAAEPHICLCYRWLGRGLDSVVTWTLTPSATGTHLRLQQSGFRNAEQPAYQGARAGWPRFLDKLEQVLVQAG